MPPFPFSAVVGQQEVKTALLLLAIDPRLGGLCISGPRGSAKSTLARSLAELLPEGEFINLPLGCSEEALLGTLDLQRVLDQQQVEFQPGLLQRAHRGVLYVDEVNLLADHLVDQLLDVSASGINRIERDGISHQHDARFLLVGTMNPDEGELRSQFQDRFGLAVALSGQHSRAERVEIVRQRERFDDDAEAFCQSYQSQQQALAESILAARQRLRAVQCDAPHREIIAERCETAQVEGLRADIVWCRAAKSHAAWQGRVEVTLDDLEAVQELVLLHRRRSAPPSSPSDPPPFSRPPEQNQPNTQAESAGDWGGMAREQSQPTAAVRHLDLPELLPKAVKLALQGKNAQQTNNKPSWFATIVSNRGCWPWQSLAFQRARQAPQRLHVVLLDRSASTLGESAFAQAKGVVAGIARQAYLARQQLLVIGFGNQRVEELLPRQRAPKNALAFLDGLTAAGGTPLREALNYLQSRCQRWLQAEPELQLMHYLISDGRSRQSLPSLRLPGRTVVIDSEVAAVKRGRCREIAALLQAEYWPLAQLKLL